MAWEYQGATIVGDKLDPQPGAYVVIRLVDPLIEGTKSLRWGFDGTQTKGQFVAMVRRETTALLRHLNLSPPFDDMTPEFDPTL